MDEHTDAPPVKVLSLVEVTARIVAAFASKNAVAVHDLPRVVGTVFFAITSLGKSAPVIAQALRPAVAVKNSITPNYLVCLEDGRRFKSMKRHLGLLGMTPKEYRTKWSLPVDYPMVAPNYSLARSGIAKATGLGRKRP